MASQVEAGLRVVRVVGDAVGVLDVTHAAEQTDAAAEVLGLSVEIERVLDHLL